MDGQEWSSVITVTLMAAAQCEETLVKQLAAALQRLSLPQAVRDRVQIRVLGVLRQACEPDHMAVQLAVFVQTMALHAEEPAYSWGCFVVEKGRTVAVPRCIEVFLYPEMVQRPDERQP